MDRSRQFGQVPRLALRGKAELGAALGVSEDHAATFAHEIASVRRGRVVVYPIASVQAWLDENAERLFDHRRSAAPARRRFVATTKSPPRPRERPGGMAQEAVTPMRANPTADAALEAVVTLPLETQRDCDRFLEIHAVCRGLLAVS